MHLIFRLNWYFSLSGQDFYLTAVVVHTSQSLNVISGTGLPCSPLSASWFFLTTTNPGSRVSPPNPSPYTSGVHWTKNAYRCSDLQETHTQNGQGSLLRSNTRPGQTGPPLGQFFIHLGLLLLSNVSSYPLNTVHQCQFKNRFIVMTFF